MGNTTTPDQGKIKTGVKATVTGWVQPMRDNGDFVSKAGNRTLRRAVKCAGRDGAYYVELMTTDAATVDRLQRLPDDCVIEAWGSEEVRAYVGKDGQPKAGRTIWCNGFSYLADPQPRGSRDEIPF
ncbi:MAG: hypothetical protein FJ100_21895 [Deltaproteobacteria bacterium]|nr:hypothetical protein [Deltaproteobacteria bacterium]